MRIAIVVGLLLVFGCAARGKGIDRHVERGSQLETELGYKLSVHDKHDEWRSQGLDDVSLIEGPAPEYVVKFRATAAGKLKDLSGLTLTVKRANEIVVGVPLAIRSIWNKENEIDVQFLIKKDMIDDALLTLRCERRSEAGGSYIIRLRDYVQAINLPKKSLPNKSLTEAVPSLTGFCTRRKSTFPNTYCLKLSSRFTYSTSVRALFGRSRGFLATSVLLFGSRRTAPRS